MCVFVICDCDVRHLLCCLLLISISTVELLIQNKLKFFDIRLLLTAGPMCGCITGGCRHISFTLLSTLSAQLFFCECSHTHPSRLPPSLFTIPIRIPFHRFNSPSHHLLYIKVHIRTVPYLDNIHQRLYPRPFLL